MNKLNSFVLKIMAIIFMAMDHIHTYVGVRTSIDIPIWFGYFGKLAAPIFTYLVVEGFYHTRSRKKYLQRLFGMAIVMIFISGMLGITNNIFLTLGVGVLLMCIIEYVKNNKEDSKKRILGILGAIVCAIIMFLFTEGGLYELGMVLIFYFLREKKKIMALTYIAFCLLQVATAIGPNFWNQIMLNDYQWMMLFAIIPILMYNGERGLSNTFVKWMFYWFYPIHLIILVTLGNFLAQSHPPKHDLIINEQLMQQVVTKIDAKTNFVDEEKVSVHLKGEFKGVYTIELFDPETKVLIASEVEQKVQKDNAIDIKVGIEPELKSTTKFVKGRKYVLSVREINSKEVLFENELVLD